MRKNGNISRRRNRVYWIAQILGWSVIIGGNALNLFLRKQLLPSIAISLLVMFLGGLIITHVFRELYHRWEWNSLSLIKLLPRVLGISLVQSLIFTLITGGVNDLLPGKAPNTATLSFPAFFLLTMNFVLIFLSWNIIYFAVHYFENQRKAEIRNLELRAVNTEIELNNLRNQLRPHFMFNSLNSIRALIEENPDKAKSAVTTLSAILRNTLLIGKKQLVSLSEELELVNKYLSMEKIRFEERLEFSSDVEAGCYEILVPPLIVQTLVENAIKHGIAQLTDGGKITINASMKDDVLRIIVTNTGELTPNSKADGTQTGHENIDKRLRLLYGDHASFQMKENDGEVSCKLLIPKHLENESISS